MIIQNIHSTGKIQTIYHLAEKLMIILLLPGNRSLISEDKLWRTTVHVEKQLTAAHLHSSHLS